jgi:hypothetical protein
MQRQNSCVNGENDAIVENNGVDQQNAMCSSIEDGHLSVIPCKALRGKFGIPY